MRDHATLNLDLLSSFLDRGALILLSPVHETASLDRHLKGAGDSFCRLLSFFQDLFRTRRSAAC